MAINPLGAAFRIIDQNFNDFDAQPLYSTPQGLSGDEVTSMNQLTNLPQFNMPYSSSYVSMLAQQQTAAPASIALTNMPEFKALSADNQQRVRNALQNAKPDDPQIAKNIKSLLQNKAFSRLKGNEQTAVLSQIQNYPNSHSIANVERLLEKDWFQKQNLANKQRSLKLVAYLSMPDSNKKQNDIQNNTLDRFLSPGSNYKLDWKAIPASGGNITLGYAANKTLTLNSYLVAANNNPVKLGGYEERVIVETAAHEVSHLVNGDKVSQTFEYLNEEYRAWYVGFLSQNGRPPTNQEAVDRWEYFLNPNGSYASSSQGALKNSGEAKKIFDLLSKLTGIPAENFTTSNYGAMMADQTKWKTNPNAPASDKVFPSSDDLDN